MALYLVDEFARPAGDPGLLAIGERAHADPGGLVRLRIHQHHVRQVDRPLALDDAALPELLGWALVLLDHVDVLDEDAPLVLKHAQDLALLPALLARHHDDRVALPHVCVCHAVLYFRSMPGRMTSQTRPEGGRSPRRTWVYVEGCGRPRTWLFELSRSAARRGLSRSGEVKLARH